MHLLKIFPKDPLSSKKIRESMYLLKNLPRILSFLYLTQSFIKYPNLPSKIFPKYPLSSNSLKNPQIYPPKFPQIPSFIYLSTSQGFMKSPNLPFKFALTPSFLYLSHKELYKIPKLTLQSGRNTLFPLIYLTENFIKSPNLPSSLACFVTPPKSPY